jgi:hypothetical protein
MAGLLVCLGGLSGQEKEKYFVGAFGGFSILGSDGNSMLSEEFSHTSSYKPETGPSVWLFGGRHIKEYFSLQGSYSLNRNDLKLSESQFANGEFQFYEQRRSTDMHSVIGEAMLYFRPRGSWYRPYLTLGGGLVHFSSGAGSIKDVSGTLPPPGGFSDTVPAVRIAVGIDLFLKDGWAFRYCFSETISSNSVGNQLTPQGIHRMQNFQNLFGIAKHF